MNLQMGNKGVAMITIYTLPTVTLLYMLIIGTQGLKIRDIKMVPLVTFIHVYTVKNMKWNGLS